MRTGITFTLSPSDRKRLRAIVADPKSPQKHVWRARIVLLSGDDVGTNAIMAETGKSKTCVIAPIAQDRVAQIVRLTHEPPPHEATHWTLRAMAKVAGIAASSFRPARTFT